LNRSVKVLLGVVAAALIAVLPLAGTATASASPRPATSATVHPATQVANVTIHVKPNVAFSGTGCTHNIFGTQLVCIYVNGTGLVVNYATVTNKHAPTGQALISDTYDGVTYGGPYNFGPGKAWRHNFYLHMSNGSKVCGSVSGLDVACLTIHS
jgi:hypothetical protein